MCDETDLKVRAELLCRFCGKQLREGDLAYFCPTDKCSACIKCKDKDNKYDHLRKQKDAKTGHEHFFVRIQKEA